MSAFGGTVRRYAPADRVVVEERAWPNRTITSAPRWLSTDLRDGNQALVSPMDPLRKLEMFRLLTELGYREIEVGFPVASRDDHDFLRRLIEEDMIPDDVQISVLTPAREELIRRTVASLVGARRATIHLYNATSPMFRRVVFGLDRAGCKALAVTGVQNVLECAGHILADCELGFQYSPEMFDDTEPDFCLEVCEAVMDVWQPAADRPITLNFPATVERNTPNVFADRIEWMHRHLSRREHLCLSVHPHNDRGTGVAAAELALLAGAERVEGCLFGNGERAGNVDLVTLGLNLYSQGVDPGIDFSNLNHVRRVVEETTGLPVHPRHPYGGDLVYTAFSGSHQDAIRKGYAEQNRAASAAGIPAAEARWEVPYLPVDPSDVGRTYESVIRINSQSGKGGIAYVIGSLLGLRPPRDLLTEFAAQIQRMAETGGGEITPERTAELFTQEYVLQATATAPLPLPTMTPAALHIDGTVFEVGPTRADQLEHLRHRLLPWNVDVRSVHRTDSSLGDPAVYAELLVEDQQIWGVGMHEDLESAALSAVRSAAARLNRPAPPMPDPRHPDRSRHAYAR